MQAAAFGGAARTEMRTSATDGRQASLASLLYVKDSHTDFRLVRLVTEQAVPEMPDGRDKISKDICCIHADRCRAVFRVPVDLIF